MSSTNISRNGPSHRPISYHPKPTATDEGDERNNHGVNVKVVVRVRPVLDNERKEGAQFNVLQAKTDTREVVVSQTIPGGRKTEAYSKTFAFDGVCSQFATQDDVFHSHILPIVDEVLQGFNCTIFAYGQTGTGKTYTMEGDVAGSVRPVSTENGADGMIPASVAGRCTLSKGAGIIPRAVQRVFDCLEKQNAEYSVKVSYLEIYNEELHDLLNEGERQNMRIFDDPSGKRGLSVDKLEEVSVNSPQDILNILSTAVKKRRTAETLLNRMSSRSHCIFSITIHIKEPSIEGEDVIKVGKLNLVDLAGSENIQRSGANTVKDRAKEAGMINQSLLTLGRVINALVEHSSYVPYRDSKLTRLLQESLGGRTKTLIVATVSPSSLCLEETLSTLDYAHRAKNIRNRPEVNQRMTKRIMVKELTNEIDRLKIELLANREKNGVYLPHDKFTEMESQIAGQSVNLQDFETQVRNIQLELDTSKLKVTELRQEVEVAESAKHRVEQSLQRTATQLDNSQAALEKSKGELEASKGLLRSVRQSEVQFCGAAHGLSDFLRSSLSVLSSLWTAVGEDRLEALGGGRALCMEGEMIMTCAASLTKVAEQLSLWEVESQTRIHVCDEGFEAKLRSAAAEHSQCVAKLKMSSERTSEGLLKLFNDFSRDVIAPHGETIKTLTNTKLQSFQNVLQEGHSSVSSHLQLCRSHVDSCTDLVEGHSTKMQEHIDSFISAAAAGRRELCDAQEEMKTAVAALDAQRRAEFNHIQRVDLEFGNSLGAAVEAVSEKLTNQVASLVAEFKSMITANTVQRSSAINAKLDAANQLSVSDHASFDKSQSAVLAAGEVQQTSIHNCVELMRNDSVLLQKNFVSETAAIREALSTATGTATALPPKYKGFCKEYSADLRAASQKLSEDSSTALGGVELALADSAAARQQSTGELEHLIEGGSFKTATDWLRSRVAEHAAASQAVAKQSADTAAVDSKRVATAAAAIRLQHMRVEDDVYASQRAAITAWDNFVIPSVESIVHHELLDVHHVPMVNLNMSSSPPALCGTDAMGTPKSVGAVVGAANGVADVSQLHPPQIKARRPAVASTTSCASAVSAGTPFAAAAGGTAAAAVQSRFEVKTPQLHLAAEDAIGSSKMQADSSNLTTGSECDSSAPLTELIDIIDDEDENQGCNRAAPNNSRVPFSSNRKTRLRAFGVTTATDLVSPRKALPARASSSRLKRKSPQPDSNTVDCEPLLSSDRKISRIGSATRSSAGAAQKKILSSENHLVTNIPTKRTSARRAL